MKEFKLPDPGEGLTEATIIGWKFAEGDDVKVNDIILEVETSKSLVELPTPWTGKIHKILVAEGAEVEVGTPIVLIDDGTGDEVEAAPTEEKSGGRRARRGVEAPAPAAAPAVSAPAAGGAGRPFNLPDPGEGLTEATITSWKVKEGDQVKVNDIIVEVETSKSLVELPTPWTGTIVRILEPEGKEVAVGAPIVMIDDGSVVETPADDGDADGASGANLVGYGSRPGASHRRARKGKAAPEAPAAVPVPVADSAPVLEAIPAQRSGKALAKPPVRKFAKDNGVDLTQVTPSGEGGVVTRADVEAFLSGAQAAPAAQAVAAPVAAAAPAPVVSSLESRREPIKGVRKVTAKAMVDSAFTKPHVTEWVDVDVTGMMELIDTIRARRDFRDVKVSATTIVAKAVCIAMARTPQINASWDEASQEIVLHGDVNLGIAAATPRGLMVPNIKGAQQLSMRQLAEALNGIVKVAKEGKLQPADYSGGTFSISNVGVFGVDCGTPIINGSESAILVMGSVTRKPWVVGTGAEERIEPRWVTTLGLSFDHRLIDGEQGSVFLRDVADLISTPEVAMLF